MALIREVDFVDAGQVSTLTQMAGWGPVNVEGWDRLWRRNPAFAVGKLPRGWILEDAGRVVGYLCNVARLYRWRGATLRAASASSLVVLPEFRGLSLQLLLQYARQKGADLLLNTTAAPHVTKICEFLGFDRVPQRDYDVSFYWILRSRPFLSAALRKKGVRAPWDRGLAYAVSPAGWVYARARHRLRHRVPRGVVISVDSPVVIDDAFDALWERSALAGDRLLAYRTVEALRWQFTSRGEGQWPFLVTARAGTRLVGYAIVLRQDARHLGLPRARFGDVFVEGDDPNILRAVLAVAVREAGRLGSAMVEFIGFPAAVRDAALALGPLALRSGGWPFVYRAGNSALHRALAREEVWYASLFDGDGSL